MSAAELSRPIVILSSCITFLRHHVFAPGIFFEHLDCTTETACYKWLLLKICVISSLSADFVFVNTAYLLYADKN